MMNLKLNHKKIKDMCGSVSFKRGDSFFRANKVTISDYREDYCEAIVHGNEDFYVTITRGENGGIQPTCSCPPLLSYSKHCQHIAAVLIAIHERKRQGTGTASFEEKTANDRELADDFLALFENKTNRTSGRQLHFEKREVLNVHFTLKPVAIDEEQYLFGIEMQIETTKVKDIRGFLSAIQQGKAYRLSSEFTYNPEIFCFTNEVDVVLHQLIRVCLDEGAFFESLSKPSYFQVDKPTLLLPPSAWNVLVPLLNRIPFLTLVQSGHFYKGLDIQDGPLPIQFIVEEADNLNYRLKLSGIEQVIIFETYSSVLVKGSLYQLAGSDFERLFELKQMLVTPEIKYIPVPEGKLEFFLKKVVPGLKKIGQVQLSKKLTDELLKKPLKAKVYLDRIKNRLLVGLEFHYENIVIQPLENRENPTGPYVVRDVEKEDEILHLMEESGFTKTEGGYFMQNEDLEYDFLYYGLSKLQKLAQIYATTAVRNRVVSNQHPKIRVKIHKERTNWLEFKFEMEGLYQKHIKEILAALDFKQKYYRMPNGSLLSLQTKEMESIRRFLEAEPLQDDHYQETLDRPILQSLKFLDLMTDSPVFEPEESFRQFLDQLLHPTQLDFEVPNNLEPILRDYQKTGYKWMKALAHNGFGGVLADDMGLGKTIQSITFIVSELENIRKQNKPVLIVCPSSLTYNWSNELMKFAPEIQAIVMDGTQAERKILQQNLNELDVLITSYPLLRSDISWYKKQSFHTVFFDEAQAFKNPFTQTARTVKQIQADHRFGLTGTPIENSIEELWSIYYVVFPELFKGLEDFSHLQRKDVAKRVRPFLLRRMKVDVLGELPEKQETIDKSELLPEQKQLYAALLAKLREDTFKHLDRDTLRKNKIRILAGLTRLRQICCHPALFVDGYQGSSAKFQQLLKILEESKLSGRRVLIFSQFTKMLDLIGRELTERGQSFFYLDGQTPSEERVELCQRFNEGERDLFLISLKAGGTGLNLTGADTVILYDLWWNPAVEEQAADRAHRIGQKKSVEVIKLVAKGTIEEKINELQEKKRTLISDILEPDEKIPTTLSEEDIREILMI